MKAHIVNAYSYRNAGDAAIMLSTAALLNSLGVADVKLWSRYVADKAAYAVWGVGLTGPLISFPTAGTSFQRTALFVASSLRGLILSPIMRWLSKAHPRVARALWPAGAEFASADIAIIAGGGYFYTSRRRVNLSFVHSAISAWAASRICGRTVMMPASIGPINSRTDAHWVKWSLKGTPVVLRELRSLKASTFEPELGRVAVKPDVAFFGAVSETRGIAAQDVSSRPPRELDGTTASVRIVVLDWRWSRSVNSGSFAQYLAGVAEAADDLSRRGMTVTLGGHSSIPEHGQDDIAVARQVQELCEEGVLVDENCDVGHLYDVYSDVDVVVGTRLHACIMALALGVPAIAIAYQEKAIGVLELFDPTIRSFWADRLDAPGLVSAVVDTINANFHDRAADIRQELLRHYGRAIEA